MICYKGNVNEFKYDMLWKTFDQIFPELYSNASESERKSWDISLLEFSRVIWKTNLNDNVKFYLEYKFDFCESRCDVIISGKINGIDKVAIVELKQHNNLIAVTEKNDVLIKKGKNSKGYLGSQIIRYLNFFDTISKLTNEKAFFELIGIAYLHNMDKNTLLQKKLKINENIWPVYEKNMMFFTKNDNNAFANYLDDLFLNADESYFIEIYDEAKNNRGFKTVDVINKKTSSHEIILTHKQMEIANEVRILTEQKNKEKKLILIEGGAGTGKTIFLYYLYLHFKNMSRHENETFLMARNPTYVKNLNLYLDKNYKFKTSSKIKELEYSENKILMFDEAQRVTMEQINKAFEVSDTIILCLDEQQKINPRDNVTKLAIKRLFTKKYPKGLIYENNLTNQIRFLKNSEYISMVDSLFSKDDSFIDSSKANINLFNDLNQMNNKIRGLVNENPDLSIKAFSINDNRSEFNPGWLKAPFSKNEIASIYYVHGFEVDYVIIYIPKGLEVNDVNFVSFKDRIKNNRFKTLLTRALIGSYIYCEDEKIYDIIRKKLDPTLS